MTAATWAAVRHRAQPAGRKQRPTSSKSGLGESRAENGRASAPTETATSARNGTTCRASAAPGPGPGLAGGLRHPTHVYGPDSDIRLLFDHDL